MCFGKHSLCPVVLSEKQYSSPVLAPPAQFRAMACASFDSSSDFPRRSLSTALVLAHNILRTE